MTVPGGMAAVIVARPGGHRAVAGVAAAPVIRADLRTLYLSDLTIHGCTRQRPGDFEARVARINAARIRPRIAGTYGLHEIARARADFAQGGPGKLVLIPPERIR